MTDNIIDFIKSNLKHVSLSEDQLLHLSETVQFARIWIKEIELKPFFKNLPHPLNVRTLSNHLSTLSTEKQKIPPEFLLKVFKEGAEARNKIANANFAFAISKAKNFVNFGEDAIQEAFIGVLEGAERYWASYGYTPTTYLANWIRLHLNSRYRYDQCSFKIVQGIFNDHKLIKKAIDEYKKIHDTSPSTDWLCKHLDLSLSRVVKSIKLPFEVSIYERRFDSSEGGDLISLIETFEYKPENYLKDLAENWSFSFIPPQWYVTLKLGYQEILEKIDKEIPLNNEEEKLISEFLVDLKRRSKKKKNASNSRSSKNKKI